jgi:hypothetical protein
MFSGFKDSLGGFMNMFSGFYIEFRAADNHNQ